MQTTDVKLTDLHLYPNNPRRGNIDLIADSLKTYGQYKPITVNSRNNQILAGNHTFQAAQKLGWKTIAATFVDVDDNTAAKIVAIDNKATDSGEYDNTALLDLLENLDTLDGTGYTSDDIDDLLDFLEHPFKTKTVNVDTLKPHPQNYQEHPADQIDHIVQSIKLHGFYRNVVIANDNTILAGHGVVKAAKTMGKKRIPVIQLDIAPDDDRALKVLTSDNEIGNLAEVDDRALTELLKTIMHYGTNGLQGTGFNEQQLSALAFNTRTGNEINTINEAAEWLGMPDYEPKAQVLQVVVSFADAQDRADFFNTLGYRFTDKTKSVWFPDKQNDDVSAIRYEDQA